MVRLGPYLKGITGALMAGVTAATPYYGQDKWFVIVTASLGAIMVYLVPNLPKGSLSMSSFGASYNPMESETVTTPEAHAPIPAEEIAKPDAITNLVVTTYSMNDSGTFVAGDNSANVVAVYLGGPNAYHEWTDAEERATAGKLKLPIWVPKQNATANDARQVDIYKILNMCIHWNIPIGSPVAFDLETSKADIAYMREMQACLAHFAMGIIGYASKSVINQAVPSTIWKWDADWTHKPHLNPGSAATQWTDPVAGKPYDQSLIDPALMNLLKWR